MEPPADVSKYGDLSVIGNGAYGTVYKSRDTKSGKFVALKRIRIQTDDEGMPMSTLREIAFLKQMNRYDHPNIVKLLDVCLGRRLAHETRLFLVFEFLEMDLSQYLKKCPEPSLPPERIKDLFKQLLCAVDFLHTLLVIHRDIKPQNCLITGNGQLKLCDFGLSRFFQNLMPLTSVVVTLWYRAPEVLLNADYALAVDLWSAGCILAELSTKEPFFKGQTEGEQLHKVFDVIGLPSAEEWPESSVSRRSFRDSRPQNLEHLLPELEPLAVDLLQKLLAFNPRKRITAKRALEHPYFVGETTNQHESINIPSDADDRRTAVDSDKQKSVLQPVNVAQETHAFSTYNGKEVKRDTVVDLNHNKDNLTLDDSNEKTRSHNSHA